MFLFYKWKMFLKKDPFLQILFFSSVNKEPCRDAIEQRTFEDKLPTSITILSLPYQFNNSIHLYLTTAMPNTIHLLK